MEFGWLRYPLILHSFAEMDEKSRSVKLRLSKTWGKGRLELRTACDAVRQPSPGFQNQTA